MLRLSACRLIGFLLVVITFGVALAQPLTGIKSIGATNSDYVSVRAAAQAAQSYGVAAGGVIFRIQAGYYTDSALTIPATFDSVHQVIFTVDSGAYVTLEFQGTSTASGLHLTSSYISFDGRWSPSSAEKHLNIVGNPVGVWFADGSDHNTVRNCFIGISSTSSQSSGVQISGTGNRLLYCDVTGGQNGIYAIGNSPQALDGDLIQGCNVLSFTDYGIYTDNGTGMTVTHNTISQSTFSNSSRVYGIYSGSALSGCRFDANKISQMQANYIFGIYAHGTNTYSNNMITIGSGGNLSMHALFSFGAANKFLFNSVVVSGSSPTNNSSCYYNEQATNTDTLWGNVFTNLRTGTGGTYHTCIYLLNPVMGYCNYNLFNVGSDSSNDNRFIARINRINYNTLPLLQLTANWAPNDSDSYSELAPFVADSNLHIQTGIPTLIELGASSRPDVLTDFDGDTRSVPSCDIGADEGNFGWISFGTITGVVRDSIPSLPPVPGVLVAAGRYGGITDSNGVYSLRARPGTFPLIVSRRCYATDTITTITVDTTRVDTVDCIIYHPEILTDVSSVEMVASPGEMRSTTLLIRNMGNSALHWYGTPVVNPGGIGNWLTISPLTGSVPPHQIVEIFVEFTIDSTASTPSDWSGTFTLISDACPETLLVPITVNIIYNSAEIRAALVHEYKLYPNYPNPFNATTNIGFSLAAASKVKCAVFDVTGRQVMTLLSESYLQAGVHSMRFNGTRLSSGVYFVRIQAGRFSAQQKIVLLK